MTKEECKKIITRDLNHQKNGHLIELFKQGDLTTCYLSACSPGAFKGYHLHRIREANYVCVKGEILIILYTPEGRQEHLLSANNPERLHIPTGVPTGLHNIGEEEAWIINYPNPPYDPKLTDEQVDYTEEQCEKGEHLKPSIEFDFDGNKLWKLNGKLHRTDGPAMEWANGDQEWYFQGKHVKASSLEEFQQLIKQIPVNKSTCKTLKDGTKKWYFKNKLHREDGPAVEFANGDKWWCLNEQLHRTDGPAIEYADGDKAWYLKGQRHRTDGPAIERANGTKKWCVNGQFHRTDGPAIEYVNGHKEWWYQGKQIKASSLEEFQQFIIIK